MDCAILQNQLLHIDKHIC